MNPRFAAFAAALSLLAPTSAGAGDPSSVLFAAEGNRLRRFDIDTIASPPLLQDILINRASADESGGPFPAQGFRDINGMICLVPDGSGRLVAGEDTGQPTPPAGWGVFDPDGSQVGKLTATYLVAPPAGQPEPFGCAFDAEGRLFTTEIGEQGFGTPNGQLIVWFPPYDRFPGPPGAYPNTNAPSTNFCKIATDIGTATGVAVDHLGRVYVASSSGLQIQRFLPPFPTSVAGCTGTDPVGSPLATGITRQVFATGQIFTGLAMAPNGNLYAANVISGEILEYDLSGTLVRKILDPPTSVPPHTTGTPQGLAVDADGTLYYADLDLVGTLPNIGPGPNGKVRRIPFDGAGNPLPPEIIRAGLAFPDGVGVLPGDLQPVEWRTYAGGPSRHFYNPAESQIKAANVAQLAVRWTFPTGAIVTAPPQVARIAVPGEGVQRIVYIQSWDANVYAIRLRNGSQLWSFATALQPGANFPNVGGVHVEAVGGAERVFVGAGETLYALDALTGQEIWRFEAGTGCGTGLCAVDNERNEIESSPIVADGKVFFGMDVNDRVGGKGGFYAVDALDGRLVWFFDLESGATCRPLPGDNIRRFDGYHSEVELGLPAGFLASRPGCAFPRSRNGCGNVWSSPALDAERGLIFFASSNCDTDTDPGTLLPSPPMPPYDEAIVALQLDGTPAWRWRPREVDNADLAFGAVPNLFTIQRDGRPIDVVGVGNKDGTYYVLDRDGVNELSGVRWDDPLPPSGPIPLPYWSTNVVPGGVFGGLIGTASVDEAAGRIYFGTAPGTSPFTPQQPTVHALDKDTGAILWQNTAEGPSADANFAPASGIPGVVFAGGVLATVLRAYDATNGSLLLSFPVGGIGGMASGAAVVDGLVMVGAGIGVRTGNPADQAEQVSRIPQNVTALCVPGTPACETATLVGGKSLNVADRPGAPQRRRVAVSARDAAIVLPQANGPDDPIFAGGALALLNPDSGESASIPLPAAGWSPIGSRGFRYRDSGGALGPCRSAVLKAGVLRVLCTGAGIGFSLDEEAQGRLAVGLRLGSETTYCMEFGGRVRRDVGTAAGKGLFLASGAPAPDRCPLP